MKKYEYVLQDGPKDCGVCSLLTIVRTYGISRNFNRKTFYPNPQRRCNYVHQRVRFRAYLVIAYGGLVKRKKNNIELYFGDRYTIDHDNDYKVDVLESEKNEKRLKEIISSLFFMKKKDFTSMKIKNQ